MQHTGSVRVQARRFPGQQVLTAAAAASTGIYYWRLSSDLHPTIAISRTTSSQLVDQAFLLGSLAQAIPLNPQPSRNLTQPRATSQPDNRQPIN